MSVPDYSQRAEDHRSVLVLLKAVGPHKSTSYNQIFERISRLNSVRIPDAKRTLHLRYRRNVPLKNNEWGDFQAHRKVTGLICVAMCNTLMDIANIQANFDSIRMGYESTLFNARCFVFGLENTSLDNSQMPARPDFTYFSNFEKTVKLEDHVHDFITSLFWVLESKRLDRSSERGDRQTSLLMAPIEKKDFVGVDTDSRNFKKKIQGRLRKHLGDLCLQADMLDEAFNHYQAATEVLKSANDWLWLAGSLEGMCSASVILLYPPTTLKQNFYRNPAYHSFHGSPSRLKGTRARQKLPVFEPTNGFSNASGEAKPSKVFLQPDEIIEKYREAIIQYSKYKSAGIVEMEASIKATRVIIAQRKFKDAAEILQNMVYINLQLTDDEKTHRYNSLSSLYHQIGYHRKAAFFKRVAAMQCVAPQNTNPAWLTCHTLLIDTMSSYHLPIDSRDYNPESTIGWPMIQLRVLNELVFIARKLGKAPVAIRHLCYLLHTMFEHLAEAEQSELASSLQAYTAKEPCPGNPIALESGLILPPVPLFKFPIVKSFALQNLPVHLRPVKMPSDRSLAWQAAADSAPTQADSSSPFIYSPFQLQPSKVEDPDQPQPAMDFEWVERDTCEVTLRVHNPMPCELRVENLSLLTEGMEFDTFPATLMLPPKSGPHPVSIIGSPKGTGCLKILGYSTSVMGVKSVCKLRDISCIRESRYELQVVPVLPTMKAYIEPPATSQSSAKIAMKSTDNVRGATAAFTLYAGESHECVMTLQNTGRVPVEKVNISLDRSKLKESLPEDVFSWSQENVDAQLPLGPDSKLSFSLCVNALAPFMVTSTVASHEAPITPAPYPLHKGALDDQTNPLQLPLAHNWQALEQVLEGVLNIKYTGGGGYKEGYCRQLTATFTVTIKPSLFLTSAKTMGATRSDQFYLVLDVFNCTDCGIRVEYGDSSQATLDRKESKRIAILTQRFSVTDQEQKLSPADVEVLCSQQLANMVDIRWTLIDSNRYGVANLHNLKLSSAMLSYTRVCPIVWEVSVEGRGHDPDESLTVAVGEPVEISIQVTNVSDSPIEAARISLKPYTNHDDDNQRNQWLQETLLFIGSSQISSVKVAPGQSLRLLSSFMVLSGGQVKLSIDCSVAGGGDSGQPQLWKYRPLVEITAT